MTKEKFVQTEKEKKFINEVFASLSDLKGGIVDFKPAVDESKTNYRGKVDMPEPMNDMIREYISKKVQNRCFIELPGLTYRTADGVLQYYDIDCPNMNTIDAIRKAYPRQDLLPKRLIEAKTAAEVAGWAGANNGAIGWCYRRGLYNEMFEVYNEEIKRLYPNEPSLLMKAWLKKR